MKKISIIILILVAGFIFWKREPWIKTYPTQQACEITYSKERLSCQQWSCDNVQTIFWLDCPHGSKFWKPMYQYALSNLSPTPANNTSNSDLVYTNKLAGFQVTFPSIFAGYKVELVEMGSNFGSGEYDVLVSTNDKNYGNRNGWATVMKIFAYNHDYWNKLQQEGGPHPGYLGENSNNVFAYSFWQDAPNDWLNKSFTSDQIVSTFKLTK